MPVTEDGARSIVRDRLLRVMADYPDLNPHGYGEPAPFYTDRGFCATCDAHYLLNYEEEIAYCICWLLSPERVVDTEFRHNTYGLKHRMEDQTGKYVGNGEMIAAFLILGLPIRLDDFNPAVQVAS